MWFPKLTALALVGAALLAPQTSFAFEDRGHRIVALIADHFLRPDVRTRVNEMLAADEDSLAPHDIVGAATWADKYMASDEFTNRQRFDGTRQWHFARIYASRPNIPAACFGQLPLPPGTPASEGPAQACVIDKIDQFKAELADPATAPRERLLALKYLLNLVGDIHQPMNVQDQYNEFGKLIPVIAADRSITPGTLYGYWNQALVHRLGPNEREVADALVKSITPENRELWSGKVTHIWALEAHQLGVDFANGTMLSAFEGTHFAVSPAELERGKTIIAKQLSKAGFRLARLLNDVLSPQPAVAEKPVSRQVAQAGRALAERRCRVCHVIDRSPLESGFPTTAPDFAAVANTRDMSPAVLEEFLPGPHPTMPNLALSAKEWTDVIGYIMSLRTRP